MSKVKEVLQEKSIEILLVAIVAIISVLFSIIWKEVGVQVVEQIIPNISNKVLIAISLLLFLLLLMSSLFALYFWRKLHFRINLNDYEFDSKSGISRHRKTGDLFCTTCLYENIPSRLVEREDAWWCQHKSCRRKFNNPEFKHPPAIYSSRKRWVIDI